MNILYDHQIFDHQKIGGVSRYFSEIIYHFPGVIQNEIAIKYSDNVYLKRHNYPDIKPIIDHKQRLFRGINFKGRGRIFNIFKVLNPSKYSEWSQINRNYSIELLKRQDFDVFHPTYYDNYFLEFIKKKPFVITIHDMTHELFPEFFPINDQTKIVKKELAQKAAHIIAVSENTKKDIIKILGIPDKKISVIYHGVNEIKQDNRIHVQIPGKYLLYIGSRKVYKNFLFLINSITDLLIKNDMFLFCTGTPFNNEELGLFKLLNIEHRIKIIYANESELYYLYKNAQAFIFPSLYEGFGIPVLEAFANDCPVILSETSCFQEIAGDSALFFDPKSSLDISEKLQKILDSDSLKEELKRKGRERLNLFSWRKAADQTIEVYRKCLKYQ